MKERSIMASVVTDMIIATYTHSNVFDVVPSYISRLKKYCPFKNIFLTNKIMPNEVCFVYDDNKPFSEEYVRFLERLDNEFVIFSQEDQILYATIDNESITDIVKFLQETEFHYCRLIRQQESKIMIYKDKYFLSDDKFSMQPTIWKRESLISLMKSVTVEKIFQEPQFDGVMKNFKGLYYYSGECKRGLNHYDSSIWPYIATAIVKGKWNFSEYPNELGELFSEYNITTKREFT